MDDPSALYTARVQNVGGTAGHVLVHGAASVELGAAAPEADGTLALPTGGPSPSASGLNPEQLLAMAWSTCLGETLKAVLRERRLEAEPSVAVEVQLRRDPAGGYRFLPRALVRLEGLTEDRARELAAAAHARCPVSKLLAGQGAQVTELIVQW